MKCHHASSGVCEYRGPGKYGFFLKHNIDVTPFITCIATALVGSTNRGIDEIAIDRHTTHIAIVKFLHSYMLMKVVVSTGYVSHIKKSVFFINLIKLKTI